MNGAFLDGPPLKVYQVGDMLKLADEGNLRKQFEHEEPIPLPEVAFLQALCLDFRINMFVCIFKRQNTIQQKRIFKSKIMQVNNASLFTAFASPLSQMMYL